MVGNVTPLAGITTPPTSAGTPAENPVITKF